MLDLNHGSRLDQIDPALAAVGLRLDVGVVVAIHSGSPAAATNDGTSLSRWRRPRNVDGAREMPERALPPRHRIPAYRRQLTEYSRLLRPVSGSWAWRRGRLLPEGGRTGRDASAIRMGDTTYHAMAFAEGDIDNDGRFEPLMADMKPYRSGADVDAAGNR